MDYAPSRGQALGSAVVIAMTALAVIAVDVLNDWAGSLVALAWIGAGFLLPFLAGMALGPMARGTTGRAIGASMGAAIVLLPTAGYALIAGPDLDELRLPLLWATYTPLALAQGVISIPIAVNELR